MKIFVTGIYGRLGRAIASEATVQGHTVVGLARRPRPPEVPLKKGVETTVGSYEDAALVERLMRSCDAVIHTAGPHGGHVEKLSLAEFLHSNVESVACLLETALRLGIRHVALSSTMDVLIGLDWAASGAVVLDEDSPPRTETAYGLSRLLQEQLGREFSRKYGISIASLRYMAFGYVKDADLGLSLLARRLSARDAARAAILAATKEGLVGDVFHIGPKSPLTNHDILVAMSTPEVVLEKYYPGAATIAKARGIKVVSDYFWPVTSIRKARLMLGWEPIYTFEKWLMENGWNPPSVSKP